MNATQTTKIEISLRDLLAPYIKRIELMDGVKLKAFTLVSSSKGSFDPSIMYISEYMINNPDYTLKMDVEVEKTYTIDPSEDLVAAVNEHARNITLTL